MAKLTKAQAKRHAAAVALIERPGPLNLEERETVFTDWHEGADSNQTWSSAYFTPVSLASDLRFDMPGRGTLIDLCAGIGRLAYFAGGQGVYEDYRHKYSRIVCIERNPRYVELGKRLFPEAEWICGDVLDPQVTRGLGSFDAAIMNPPFGTATKSDHKAPRYKGADMDLAVMDVAASLAPWCLAIVPRDRARWTKRGDAQPSKRADLFQQATGLDVWRFSNLDCDFYIDEWNGVAPSVEIVGFGAEFEAERTSTRIVHPAPAPRAAQLLQLRAAAPKIGEGLFASVPRQHDASALPLFAAASQLELSL